MDVDRIDPVLAERAASIVSSLDLPSRVRLLSGRDHWTTEPLPHSGVGSVTMTDGPHGLRRQREGEENIGIDSSVPATCFPTAALLASTWDPGLAERVGAAIGAEARAQGVSLVLGPGLNLKRHPAAGRNFEQFSEDPLLSGVMAAAVARGLQSAGVGACLKHYAVNNQESWRFRLDTIVDERTLRELYLRGFEVALDRCRPWAVMSSYNLVNGEHVGESATLIDGVLRGEFGFDGLVMSDWNAVSDRVAGVRAGLDLEMPGSNGTWDRDVLRAVRSGSLPQTEVDACAARVVALALRARAAAAATPAPSVDAAAHHVLAREVAAAGTVLLTNDGILPVADPTGLAVIGAFAASPRYQGAGSSLVNPTRIVTTLDALAARGIEAAFAPGYDPATGSSTQALLAEAVTVASAARTVLLMVGLPATSETEGMDRSTLALPEGHVRLIEAVTSANPRTVVALSLGAPVEAPWAALPAALLVSYLGGQASGEALVDVLLGDAEPAGRLAESWPIAATDLPASANFATHPTQVQYREGLDIGYHFHDTWEVPARFPLGHGLGYTSFDFGVPTVVGGLRDLVVHVMVTNTGEREGTAVVQAYVNKILSAQFRPENMLAGFASVRLAPGASAPIAIALDRRALEVFEPARKRWVIEAGDYVVRVAASSVDIRGSAPVNVADLDADLVTPLARWQGPAANDKEFAQALGHQPPRAAERLPYSRETLVEDLTLTWPGRALRRVLVPLIMRALGAGKDGVNPSTARAYVEGTPLRALATGSGGVVSLRSVDATVRVLNALGGRKQR